MSEQILDKWAERAAAAQRNREAFPFTSAIVTELRAHFPGAKVVWSREAGQEHGKPRPNGVIVTQPWPVAKGER